MTAPQWTRQLKWSGPELTLGDLRQFLKETAHLEDLKPVGVTVSHGRDGETVTLLVSGMLPHTSSQLSDIVIVPPDAVYAQQYFDPKTGNYNYRFFNSAREPIDPAPPPLIVI